VRNNIKTPDAVSGRRAAVKVKPLPFDHHSDVLTILPSMSIPSGNIDEMMNMPFRKAIAVRNFRNPGIRKKFLNTSAPIQ
jgi:hypothetical protein